MKNYRKAKSGDIECSTCGYYEEPRYSGKRGRCKYGAYGINYAVSAKGTCDKAFQPNTPCSICGSLFDARKGETKCYPCKVKTNGDGQAA